MIIGTLAVDVGMGDHCLITSLAVRDHTGRPHLHKGHIIAMNGMSRPKDLTWEAEMLLSDLRKPFSADAFATKT